MSEEYEELTLTEREKIHEDIERIRLVLQNDASDLYYDEDDAGVPADEVPQVISEDPIVDLAHSSGHVEPAISNIHSQASATLQETNNVNFDETEALDDLPANAAVALALNRAYQDVIEENLKRVKLVLIHNRERQSELEQEIKKNSTAVSYINDSYKKRQLSVYGIPYFKDVNGMYPPKNEDTILKRSLCEVDPFIRPPKPFQTDYVKILRDAIAADARQRLMGPLLNKKELLSEKLETKVVTFEDKDRMKKAIDDLDEEITKLNFLDLNELLEKRGNKEHNIDYMKISAIDFDGNRSAEELERSWNHFVHPKINTGKFKTKEDQQLMEIAERHQFCNWEEIAKDLGTNRTGFQCLQRYQMKLNPVNKTGKWVPEEDDILKEVVEQCRLPNGDIDWTNVSYFMEGRSYEMCQERWNIINPYQGIKKGRWKEDEDMKLMTAVQVYGQQWSKMEKFVPGRTAIQIRERYYNAYKDTKRGDWTYEEDKFIWLHVVKHGPGLWAKIAKQLKGRDDNAVFQRYKRLLKWGELASNLGNTTHDNLSLVLKKKVKDLRKDISNASKVLQGSKARQEARKKTGQFLDKTIMIGDGLSETNYKLGNKMKEELEKFHQHIELEKLVKPVKTAEEEKAEIELNQKIEEDIKQGNFIPRPPPGVESTRRYSSILSRRVSIQKLMKEKIANSVLRNCRLHNDSVNMNSLNQNIDNILAGHNSRDLDIDDLVRLKSVGKMLTVKEILDLSTSLKSRVMKSQGIKEAAKSELNEEAEIDELIGEQLYMGEMFCYTPGQYKCATGRPQQIQEMKTRVSKLMLAALNVDVKGCFTSAEKIRNGSFPRSWTSREVYDSNSDSIEKSIEKLSSVTGTPVREDKLCSVESITSKSVPRLKALSGEKSAVYKIPPLPPNCGTLKAFKNMLLQRKKLIHIAGRFHIPGSLTTGKVEKKATKDIHQNNVNQTVNTNADSLDSRSNLENILYALPPGQLPGMKDDTSKKILDLDPGSFRCHYSTEDLVFAQKISNTEDAVEELRKGQMTVAKFHEVVESKKKQDKPKLRLIEKLRKTHDYQLLNSRFQSLFLWPALLSTIPVDRYHTYLDRKPLPVRRNKKMIFTMIRPKRKRKKNPQVVNVKKEVVMPKNGENNKCAILDEITEIPDYSSVEEGKPKKRVGRPKGGGKKRYSEQRICNRTSNRKRKSTVILDFSDEVKKKKSRKRNSEAVCAYLKDYVKSPKKHKQKLATTSDFVDDALPQLDSAQQMVGDISCDRLDMIKGEQPEPGDEKQEEYAQQYSENTFNQQTALDVHNDNLQIPEYGGSILNNSAKSEMVPCILVGNQLIPLNHPLLEGLLKMVKAQSSEGNLSSRDNTDSNVFTGNSIIDTSELDTYGRNDDITDTFNSVDVLTMKQQVDIPMDNSIGCVATKHSQRDNEDTVNDSINGRSALVHDQVSDTDLK